MKKNRKSALCAAGVSLAVVMAAAGLGGCSAQLQVPDTIQIRNVEGAARKIAVTGQEEVKIVPDMAQIQYAVYTQAATAAECQNQNSEDLSKAIETLKGLGVEEKSIQTSSYGMNPIYDWNSGSQTITGYEMTTEITVSDIPITEAGSILTKSVEAGVNRINSVSYFASDYDTAYQEALKGAMKVAEEKALALAEAGGKTLGTVVNVEEFGYNPDTRYSGYNDLGAAKMEASSGAAADMAVMPGEVSVEARVTVEYELQ